MALWKKIGLYIAGLTLVGEILLMQAGTWEMGIALAVAGVAVIYFTRMSLAPLDQITSIVEGIAEGELDHNRLVVVREDELGRLAAATNRMLSQLNSLARQAEGLVEGKIGILEAEERALRSERLFDHELPGAKVGRLERSFVEMANQMRGITIQARIIARDNLNSPLLNERVPGELGESFALMVRNLRTIADRAKDIAEGDLSSYVEGEGDLNTAFNQMVTGLNALVEQIVQTALHISSSAGEMLVVLRDQELAASHQASGVEETQRTMETLLSSAKKIAESTQTVFKSAERTQANNRIVGDRIGELKAHTARIAEILEVIKSIADRSDLLALNASLEGMRAGEAGKGFTLVAAEMRRLAENIKASISDIKDLVSDIRESSLSSVMATDDGSRLSERTTDSALKISLITQQQQSGTEQVTQSMEELSHLINQGVAGTQQVTIAASELVDLSSNLQALVQKFRVSGAEHPSVIQPSRTSRATNPRGVRALARPDVSTEFRTSAAADTTAERHQPARDARPTPLGLPLGPSNGEASKRAPSRKPGEEPPTVEFSTGLSDDEEMKIYESLREASSSSQSKTASSSSAKKADPFESIARELEAAQGEAEDSEVT